MSKNPNWVFANLKRRMKNAHTHTTIKRILKQNAWMLCGFFSCLFIFFPSFDAVLSDSNNISVMWCTMCINYLYTTISLPILRASETDMATTTESFEQFSVLFRSFAALFICNLWSILDYIPIFVSFIINKCVCFACRPIKQQRFGFEADFVKHFYRLVMLAIATSN